MLRRTLFIAAVAFAATGNAAEDWVEVSQEMGVTMYLSPSSIEKDGNNYKVWLLVDPSETLIQQRKPAVVSVATQTLVDCVGRAQAPLLNYFYAEKMAKGKVVSVRKVKEVAELLPTPPGSDKYKETQAICDKIVQAEQAAVTSAAP